jgi:anaerobic selenocysteine-containing dehydrogenase
MSTALNPKITRRTFLKTSAAMAAVVAASDKLLASPGTMLIPTVASAAPEVVIKHGNCAFCQQGDCQTIYKMINGVVVKVEGDPIRRSAKALRAATPRS